MMSTDTVNSGRHFRIPVVLKKVYLAFNDITNFQLERYTVPLFYFEEESICILISAWHNVSAH